MKTQSFLLLFLLTSSAFASSITVSGISAGAYMAQQFHTAYSSEVKGVGIIAGGPYYCAQGKFLDALNRCMKKSTRPPLGKDSLLAAKTLEQTGDIDPVKNIQSARVYVLSGTKDETVPRNIVDVAVDTYKAWKVPAANLVYESKLQVGHAFPTLNFGNSCGVAIQSPFISNCGRDIAGEILNHLLGKLKPRSEAKHSRLFTFDQLSRLEDLNPDTMSLSDSGYAYVPENCERGTNSDCHVHVAFHGCQQSVEDVGMAFVTKTGYNEWAETNNIVVLYPQIHKNILINPNGCWDWWGYTGPNYHTKSGPQMLYMRKLIEALRLGKLQLRSVDL